jgi:hypothetical protein
MPQLKPESRVVVTCRDSPRRARYFLAARQESTQRNAPRLPGPAGCPRCERPAGPVAKLAGQKTAGVGQRARTSPGEPSSLGGSEGTNRRARSGPARTNSRPDPSAPEPGRQKVGAGGTAIAAPVRGPALHRQSIPYGWTGNCQWRNLAQQSGTDGMPATDPGRQTSRRYRVPFLGATK